MYEKKTVFRFENQDILLKMATFGDGGAEKTHFCKCRELTE
jgi:hypothetical protein